MSQWADGSREVAFNSYNPPFKHNPHDPSLATGSNSASVDALPNRTSDGATAEGASDLDVPVAQRKAKRERRVPARFREADTLPEPLPAIEEPDAHERYIPPLMTSGCAQPLVIRKSKLNVFGLMRAFALPRGSPPIHDPDRATTLRDLTEPAPAPPSPTLPTPTPPTPTQSTPASAATDPPNSKTKKTAQWGPFSSKSAFSLADWYWHSNNKSFTDFQKLIAIFKQPDFSVGDTVNVNWRAAFKALGANREDLPEHEAEWIRDDGWRTTPVTIDIPFHKRMRSSGCDSYTVGNFHHRSIVAVIKEKISNRKDAASFHYHPYEASWKPDDSDDTRGVELYGELYYSRAFRDAHRKVQLLPSTERNDGLERVVVGLMFWSDGTQLTSFGGASLWPCYMFFGNESKYRRCQPSENLGEQIAYFMKLPDKFDDYLRARNKGKLPSDGLYTHCGRELFQKQWGILLDDELIDAMKTLVAGLRNNGGCPCHRCLIPKGDLARLGAPTDTERLDQKRSEQGQRELVDKAREEIVAGFAVDGTRVDFYLKEQSLVPVHNGFSDRLAQVSFEIIPALAVDLLHEFEIGVWKKLFIHLIRLLHAFTSGDRKGPTLTAILDSRYRMISPFGRNAIRRFGENASEMKRRAARDYEDLLQCAIPAFELLIPEPHNTIIMQLLYIAAQWHTLAKLRMHHDITLQLLDFTTTWLGAQVRRFNHETCSNVATKELQREADARARREGKGKASEGKTAKKLAKFNVFTIKFHYLGDYVDYIRQFGTTDSYSTETGELYHRLPKSWFDRTDKREYEGQLSQIERRHARLDQIRDTMTQEKAELKGSPGQSGSLQSKAEELEDSPDQRYTLGVNQNIALDIRTFSQSTGVSYRDPYLTKFHQKLKEFLLPRIFRRLTRAPTAFNKDDWLDVSMDRLYAHKLLGINFTTYDVRRDQDIVHVGTSQSNLMFLNSAFTTADEPGGAPPKGVHPYLYAKALGVYHANVAYIGYLPDGTRSETTHRLDFVWVHWYNFLGSTSQFSLDRLSLLALDSGEAVGFVDPADIVRCVHLIPQFALGELESKFPPSRFADRDLFMRYQYRMGVGHTYMRKNWPSAEVPSIPPDFDHHLVFPQNNLDEDGVYPESDEEYGSEDSDSEDREGGEE